jgi:hypothetical protein
MDDHDDRLARGRAAFERTLSGLRVRIRAPRRWHVVALLAVWLCGWTYGEVSAIAALSGLGGGLGYVTEDAGATAFTAFWLVIWTIGGAFAWFALFWQTVGREEISVEFGEMTVARVVGPLRRAKRFRRETMGGLRVEDRPDRGHFLKRMLFGSGSQLEMLGVTGGSLALDYGARTHRFGIQLDPPEARAVRDRLVAELRLTDSPPSTVPRGRPTSRSGGPGSSSTP